MWLWKKFNNLNTTSKVIILILVILLIIGITSIILINYKKVENIPLQNDAILSSSSLNIEENIQQTNNEEIINSELSNNEAIETKEEKKDLKENNIDSKKEEQPNNTTNNTAQTNKSQNNTTTEVDKKQENNKQENNKTENDNKTNVEIKNEQTTGNTALANTHFKKYNKEKTNHAVAYLNSKIKQAEYYEIVGGKAIAVTEKPCKDWFSYSYDEKLNPLAIAGCTIQVYIEDEYAYDSKGINYYLYDTKAYIYSY